MRYHVRLYHEKKFAKTCERCGHVAVSLYKLQEHIRSKHTRERKYACTVEGCEKRFYNLPDMIGHRKATHKNFEICQICQAVVKNLKQHIERHNKQFVCTHNENAVICNKSFVSKSDLKEHVASQHFGVRYEICHKT